MYRENVGGGNLQQIITMMLSYNKLKWRWSVNTKVTIIQLLTISGVISEAVSGFHF